MNLNFVKRGRRFFFITLVTEGRAAVFSKIDDDAAITLTDLGETVVAAWRKTHQRNPALTASNFVIMPDHIHLLLIVNYDLDANFDLIDWIHDFMALSSPAASSESSGELPRNLGDTIPPEGSRDLPRNLGDTIPPGGSGDLPRNLGPTRPLWSRDYWLVLSFSADQIKTIRRYIKLNPARYLWKKRHPDMFRCHRAIKASSIERINAHLATPLSFDGLGNLTLLGSPFLFHVRLTLKKTVEEHRAAIDEIIANARRGMIPVSGFISPGEKEALRRLKAEPCARFIKILPFALPDHYDPSAEDSRELASGRMAILSGFRETPPISSLAMKRDPSAAHAFRRNCLVMNDIAAALCAP